jgi:hypothetical protein
METASAELIAEVLKTLSARESHHRRLRGHAGPDEAELRGPAGRRRNCNCGYCRQCQENARWERIYSERFADPQYYTGPVIRRSSPLTSL